MKLASALLIAVTACARGDVSHSSRSTRVVALVPAATEIISALGMESVLIGRAEEDSARAIAHVPSAGRVLAPSTERVVELRPDLVIAWPGAEGLLGHMRSLGARTFAARFERLDHIADNTRAIGELLGVGNKADSLAQHISLELNSVRARFAAAQRPRVLYLLDTEPFWTAGPGTFVDDLIAIAGGTNVFADLPTQWSEVSMEAVIERQPDVVIVARPARRTSREWLAHPGWQQLAAVKRNRVYFVDADDFNRPGPNVVMSAHQLARLLHSGSHE